MYVDGGRGRSAARLHHRGWVYVGLGAAVVCLLTAVGLASFEKVREASAKTQ